MDCRKLRINYLGVSDGHVMEGERELWRAIEGPPASPSRTPNMNRRMLVEKQEFGGEGSTGAGEDMEGVGYLYCSTRLLLRVKFGIQDDEFIWWWASLLVHSFNSEKSQS